MRLENAIAYGLIAMMVIAAIFGAVVYMRRSREARRIERGGRPRRR
jgi:hypothetical protein